MKKGTQSAMMRGSFSVAQLHNASLPPLSSTHNTKIINNAYLQTLTKLSPPPVTNLLTVVGPGPLDPP